MLPVSLRFKHQHSSPFPLYLDPKIHTKGKKKKKINIFLKSSDFFHSKHVNVFSPDQQLTDTLFMKSRIQQLFQTVSFFIFTPRILSFIVTAFITFFSSPSPLYAGTFFSSSVRKRNQESVVESVGLQRSFISPGER